MKLWNDGGINVPIYSHQGRSRGLYMQDGW